MASIYGEAHHSDGSKADRTFTISTSWNSRVAHPGDGWYELEFEENPQQRITVYVDGSRYDDVYVDGDTRLDIRW